MTMPNALSDAAVAGLRAIAHDLGAPVLVQRIAEPGATPDGDFYASYRDGNAWPYASATDPRVVAFLEAWTPETAAALADEVLRLRALHAPSLRAVGCVVCGESLDGDGDICVACPIPGDG